MKESEIEKQACSEVFKYLGITSSKLVTPGDTGIPDRIFWVPGGKPVLIEYKKPGEVLRVKQQKVHEWLKLLGYKVMTHDNAAYTLEAICGEVEPTLVSEESREILARARIRCAVLRSRLG